MKTRNELEANVSESQQEKIQVSGSGMLNNEFYKKLLCKKKV